MHKLFFYFNFIIYLYMFRALLCSSSGGQNCIIQHLVSSHSVGGRPVHKILLYNKFIIFLYIFRALLCSSSGGRNCIIQHLVSSHPVGGRPVHKILFYNKFIIFLTCFEHCCAHHQEVKIVLYSIWYRHTL